MAFFHVEAKVDEGLETERKGFVSENQAHGSGLAEQPGPGYFARSLRPVALGLFAERGKLWRFLIKPVTY